MNEVAHVSVAALGLSPGLELRCGCLAGVGEVNDRGSMDGADFICLGCGSCECCCRCVEESLGVTVRGSGRGRRIVAFRRPPRMDAFRPPGLVVEALRRLL